MIDLLLGWTIPPLLCMWRVMFYKFVLLTPKPRLLTPSHTKICPLLGICFIQSTNHLFMIKARLCAFGCEMYLLPVMKNWYVLTTFFRFPLPWTTLINCSTGWVVCRRFRDDYAAAAAAAASRNCIEWIVSYRKVEGQGAGDVDGGATSWGWWLRLRSMCWGGSEVSRVNGIMMDGWAWEVLHSTSVPLEEKNREPGS